MRLSKVGLADTTGQLKINLKNIQASLAFHQQLGLLKAVKRTIHRFGVNVLLIRHGDVKDRDA